MAEELHWPDAPIQDIPEEEREVLLKQAGPPGEMARVAWQRYQEMQRTDRGDEPEAVMREQVRLEEMTGVSHAPPAEEPEPEPPAEEVVDTPAEEAAETGTQTEREVAEAKAAERGLEIRDYGTNGDWRVYDPATGRQVAKSRLDEPIPV